MIQVKNLYKGYGKKPVLKNVSLQVRKGSIHGLIGRNGSGINDIDQVPDGHL